MKPDRREMLAALAALGVGTTVFQRAAVTLAAEPERPTSVTPEMVKQAEWIAGVSLSDEDRKKVAASLTGALRATDNMRKIELTNDISPAVRFDPTPSESGYTGRCTASPGVRRT